MILLTRFHILLEIFGEKNIRVSHYKN